MGSPDWRNVNVEAYLRGGLRWQSGNATWPLVRLDIRPGGLFFHLAIPLPRPLRETFPSWVQWDEVVKAQPARGRMLVGSSGVYFDVRGQEPLIFWTFKPNEVLAALKRHGVLLDPNIHRVRFFSP